MTLAIAWTFGLLLQVPASGLPAQAPAVPRFYQVDERLYRGAQPDSNGFKYLRDLGIETVINLRTEADASRTQERRMVESLGMRYISLPIEDGNFFTRSRVVPGETIERFFGALDAARGPVFVHCHRGADRTGALVAFYRIARNGWNNQRAYEEARTIGLRSWYTGLKRQILAFKP